MIVILGPTAGGKSEFAVELAERLGNAGDTGDVGGEIIGADSMQVYRELDAGTAKPEPELRARVPHHLIDIVEPTERFTVADWLDRAERLIDQIQQRGRHPIVVGGTNLYLKVLLEGMFDAPGEDPAFRAALADVPPAELHRRLAAVDPAAAERIHPNDHKRLVRALEVHHLTGRPISEQQQKWTESSEAKPGQSESASAAPGISRAPSPYRHDPILLGLDWPREAINRRINARVRAMFEPARVGRPDAESLPEEVRRLDAADRLGPQAREALGYKQVLEALRGETTMDEAMERTKILTRRFAKQQRSWLRRYRGVHWLPAAEADLATLADRAAAIVRAVAPATGA